jgi:hypothetical protein
LAVRFNQRRCCGADHGRDATRLKIQCVIHTALKQIGHRVNTSSANPVPDLWA